MSFQYLPSEVNICSQPQAGWTTVETNRTWLVTWSRKVSEHRQLFRSTSTTLTPTPTPTPTPTTVTARQRQWQGSELLRNKDNANYFFFDNLLPGWPSIQFWLFNVLLSDDSDVLLASASASVSMSVTKRRPKLIEQNHEGGGGR